MNPLTKIFLLIGVITLTSCARQQSAHPRYAANGLEMGENPYGDQQSDFTIIEGQQNAFAECYKKNEKPAAPASTKTGFNSSIFIAGTGAVFKVDFLDSWNTNRATLDCIRNAIMNIEFNPVGENVEELHFNYALPK